MPCLVILLAMLMPRLVMFFIWLLTDWFRVYEFWLWPLLGFFFMPYTTLAYMGGMLNGPNGISGGWLVALIVAIVVDLGHYGAGKRNWNRRS